MSTVEQRGHQGRAAATSRRSRDTVTDDTARRAAQVLRWVITGVAGSLALFIFGFAVFATNAMREPEPTTALADGIIVLTGGDHRVQEGGRLLREGRGRRLLISGVNPLASRDDLMRLSGLDAQLFDCCVDIGYAARDTIGNAREARAWAADRHLSSLLVVTSSSHTPRAMTVLAIALPRTVLISNPVPMKSLKRRAWWLQADTRRTLMIEYVKFLPTAALRAAMFLVPSSIPPTATASPSAPVARS